MRSALSIAAIAACASMAAARPQEGHIRCAALPSDSFMEKSSKMAMDESKGLFTSTEDQSIEIQTYFHVVASGESEDDGNVSDKMLKDQLDVLNESYKPHSISFNLVNISRTTDANWANDGAEIEMKKSLRKGGYDSLNVYYLKNLGGGNLGYCYFPDDVEPNSNDFWKDGCSVLSSTVPGGSAEQYNMGGTSTHEIGHFLGLFHTFQGGCNGAGDQVGDTPAQSSASSGCPKNRDSCPGKQGLDPIHNYMDYSVDACYEEFTAGQEKRMYNMWNTYRANANF